MKTLSLDFETYSEVDITSCGGYRYAQDPSTEVLIAAYSIGSKIHLWDATKNPRMPKNLKKWLLEPDRIITAFNANFERLILKYVLGYDLPISSFRCTMVHAYGLGFAGGLDMVGNAVGLPQDKQKLATGKRLINRFSKPAPSNHKIRRYTSETHPQEWDQFKEYCIQDVVAEQAILKYLGEYPIRDEEWADWFEDQKINDRGLPLDVAFVEKAIKLNEKNRERLLGEMKALTGLDNPNSAAQLLDWLQKQGVEVFDMQAATIQNLLDGKPEKLISKVLEAKQQIAKSSISKYQTALRSQVNGRVHGTLQFMGAARTGRWAGRLLQIQNFARGTMPADEAIDHVLNTTEPNDVTSAALSTSLRGMFKAKPKRKLVVSDLSGIEGRVLPWGCYDYEKLLKIAEGLDLYKVAASGIFYVDYDDITKDQRFVGKVAELACGYQGAVGAFTQMVITYGVEMSEKDMLRAVKGWREVNPVIVRFWHTTQRAAKNAINMPDRDFVSGKITWYVDGDFLFAELPSGRNLAYHMPAIDNQGKITYMGLNAYTRKWERLHTYGGKLCENITQAISRDILAENLRLVEDCGFNPVGSVHDEIICESRDLKKYSDKKLSELLATQRPWCLDLPLNAEGYTAQRYRK